MTDIQSVMAEIRRGKKERRRRKEETTGQKYNGLPYSIGRPEKVSTMLTVPVLVYSEFQTAAILS